MQIQIDESGLVEIIAVTYVILDKTNSIVNARSTLKFLKMLVFLFPKILYLQVTEVSVPIVKGFVKLKKNVLSVLNKSGLYMTLKTTHLNIIDATKYV